MITTSQHGRIINIASAHGLVASPFKAAYVAAKSGLAGLTEAMAVEGRPLGIRVNAVSPGSVDTPMLALSGAPKDPSLRPQEVARVIAPRGLYISQHKQPASLQAGAAPTARGYVLKEPYYRAGPLPPAANSGLPREAGTVEFLHRWEELLGGLCRSGFVIEDLVEPRHAEPLAAAGSFGHRSLYLPPFVTLKARRSSERGEDERPAVIWTR